MSKTTQKASHHAVFNYLTQCAVYIIVGGLRNVYFVLNEGCANTFDGFYLCCQNIRNLRENNKTHILNATTKGFNRLLKIIERQKTGNVTGHTFLPGAVQS